MGKNNTNRQSICGGRLSTFCRAPPATEILYNPIMRRSRSLLLLTFLILLASCIPGTKGTISQEQGAATDESSILQPVASMTVPAASGIPQVVIQSPLQIDSEHGRLYAVAQVNTEPKLVVLDTLDGHLVDSWDTLGQLALDPLRDRLVVDGGSQGVAFLNATTGENLASVDLPLQNEPPAPQINSKTGLIYAFRDATVYVIDPAIREIVRTLPLTVPRVVCDTPSGDAAIHQSAYDATAERLYLSFITHTCTPWAMATIIALDATTLTEIGRIDNDINTQFVSYDGNLYGASVSRLGPTLYWAWDGKVRWHEESGNFQGSLLGVVADSRRKVIFEVVGETIRAIAPRDRALTDQATLSLPVESRLAGHDPGSDNLYFVSPTGRLYLWPAENVFNEGSIPAAAPSPLPQAPVSAIALSPNWVADRTMAAVVQDDCSSEGGQLYLMSDPTAGWLPSSTSTGNGCEAVTFVAFSPAYGQDSLIFAASNRPPTILRSLDIGRSWTMADTPFPNGTSFITLATSPTYARDQTLFALTAAGLLYRSRDGGKDWQALDQRLDRMALEGGSSPTLHIFGSYRGRILHSTDGGESWLETGEAPNREPLTLLAASPSSVEEYSLYAFTTGGRFARSMDSGTTWNTVMETSPDQVQLAIASDVAEEQRPMFLLHNQAIIASYDGMASVWSATPVDEVSRYRPTAIALSPSFTTAPYLFAGTIDGQIIRIRADAQP